ncbi:GNAT family N-acetyltransferase [Actinomycetaceae bacterium MB13-C1-2]|nr:GNAT family N-acetyltransferase [Actinomycetaceae bacterium MB13-C1-2]
MSLEWKHLTKNDAGAWASLTSAIAEHDGAGYGMSPEIAADELSSELINFEDDSFAVWDGTQLVGWERVTAFERPRFDGVAQTLLSGGVHPNWRNRGIGTELIQRAEARSREILDSSHPDSPHVMHVDSGSGDGPSIPLLVDNGFVLVRKYQDMERKVTSPTDLPDLSELGQQIRVRAVRDDDLEEIRRAHNDAFRAHWGWWPTTHEEWADEFSSITFRPQFSRIAVNPDGRVLSYALVNELNPGHPYIEFVGARAETRGMGLGRAAISEVIRNAAINPDIETLYLDVDADNPSKAGNLYTDLGFHITRTWGAYEKNLGR